MLKWPNNITPKKIKSQINNPELVKQKHKQIVKIASELFALKGYHRTTIRDIAEASGINISYLYKYISSKDDILYLFYMQMAEDWSIPFTRALENRGENPVEELKQLIRGSLEGVNRVKAEVLTMYTETRHLERDSLKIILALEGYFVDCIDQLLKRGVEQKYFDIEDTFMEANIISYLIAFQPLRSWNTRKKYTFTRYVNLMEKHILRSIGVTEE